MTPRKRTEIASVCAVAAIALLLLLFFSVRGPGLSAPPPTTVNTNLCCTSTVSTDTTTNTAVHGSTSSSASTSTTNSPSTTSTSTTNSPSTTSTSTTNSPSTTSTSTTTSTSITSSSTTTTSATPSTVYLTVKSSGSHFVDIWANGVQTSSGFTNVSLAATAGQTFTVGALDNGCYRFSHWTDGSTQRFSVMSITANTTLTAVYSNICLPLPAGDSSINVTTVDSSGGALNGLYTTLWQNGALNQSCFSPCSFAVGPGTYQVAVSDFGGLFFNHWTDGTTGRFHTVTASGNPKINLTAVYSTVAPDSASGILIASISGIIAIVLVRMLPCLPTMTKGSGLLWIRKE